MKLVIDASNIVRGGGTTHLTEFIKKASPEKFGIEKIEVWASKIVLKKIGSRSWLCKKSHSWLEKGYLARQLWKILVLKSNLDENSLLFVPGTGYISWSGRVVTMCRNLLPLELKELDRYFFSLKWLRLRLLRILHLRAYKKSDGVIFLNHYSYNALPQGIKEQVNNYCIIPHGLNEKFLNPKHNYAIEDEFKLLNVSSISLYRHQWKLIEVVCQLRDKGYKISLQLVGPLKDKSKIKVQKVLEENERHLSAINIANEVSYKDIEEYYKKADSFIYSSTCETFGMTLLEAMGSSLPILCSNQSSMHELLEDAGLYFNPDKKEEIKSQIINLYSSIELRKELGHKAHKYAKKYNWRKTAEETLDYISEVYER